VNAVPPTLHDALLLYRGFSEAKWPADTLLLASTLIIFLSLVVLERVVRITKGPREERHGSRRRKNAVVQAR